MASEEDDELYDEQEEDEEPTEPGEDLDDDEAFVDDEGDDDEDSLLDIPTDVSIRRRSGKKGLVVEGEPKAKLEKPKVAKQVWDRLTKKFDGIPSRKYAMSESFAVDDVLKHPKFGRGYVIEVPGRQKIEVLFEEGLVRLVHEK